MLLPPQSEVVHAATGLVFVNKTDQPLDLRININGVPEQELGGDYRPTKVVKFLNDQSGRIVGATVFELSKP